ncbi:MAG: response regulator transcription factor [Chloroflexi bacterium]|nr:response regulator transcription factor [Chloroflexota bacterium]
MMTEPTSQPEQEEKSPQKIRILVAEDDEALRQLLEMSLRAFGYDVLSAADGVKALELFLREPVDLAILDIMMPRMDGLELLQELRRRSDLPIIMLTALSRPDDVVRGLRLGADDYIPKPFTFKEVAARVEAALRRSRWAQEQRSHPVLQECGVTLDAASHEVYVEGEEVHLSPTEFALLHYLMQRAGEAVSKEELFREVWGYEFSGGSNLVEVAIRRLRYKIEKNPQKPARIVTVRGVGYKFCRGKKE